MSYCRWNEGDLYCYHHSDGYATHVRNGPGLSHDGEIFQDKNSFHFMVRLLKLRAEGYKIPDHAIQRAREEWRRGAQ